ncbi:trigger factor [Thiomicrospira cyclica]|uniref:Trigger factor n=1 Tax=Thiomicrospira cyclica (strain DSM 14477 / JCM 11371 / ALM1) TaxID=717773 RepID=F6DC44_THICA|nr:trigger factor [Thiomicrospira cyclica]AEG31430.1 Trigger factor [Thiomicrospira cyclica ALM1]
MQVSVEKPEQGLEYKMTVTFPSDEFDAKVEKRLAEVRRTVKMDGFRPGKVPLAMVKKRYSGQVRQEMLGETLYDAFFKAAGEQSVNVAGYPEFENVDMNEGKIEFTAKFEVFPEVTLPDLKGLELEEVSSEVTEADVDAMIGRLQAQRSAWKPAGAAKKANKGEQVIIDFVGKVDGVEFDGGKAENVPLELGSGRMIPGFEDGILGMKKGEQKTIDVTFPEQYPAEHLKGKTAQFDITVHSVQTKQMPELDEEFIKSFGVEAGTVEGLRAEVRDNMERELKRTLDVKNRQAAFDALEKATELAIPKALVLQEAQSMLEQYMERLEQQGMPKNQMPGLTADMFNPDAERRVKLGLVISDLVKANAIEASPEQLDEFIADQASAYEDPAEIREWYDQNPERLSEVKAIIVESNAAKHILAQAKVTKVTKAFDEIVSQQA